MALPEKLARRLKDHELGLTKCIRCKQCVYTDGYENNCPSYWRFGYNAYSGGGRVQLARALLDGVVELDRDLADIMFSCTTCGACTERCFNYGINSEDFNPVEITEMVREALVEVGNGPQDRQSENLGKLRENHNPFGEKHTDRLKWLDSRQVPARAETLFFVGCTASYAEQELAHSTLEIMERLGEEVAVAGDEWCCGSYPLRLGDTGLLKELAGHNLEVFKETGAKSIVTQCPGCYKTLSRDYPRLGFDHGLEVLHITQYLARLLDAGKLKFKQSGKGKTVTYHDPCHIGRHCGIYEEPRRLIEAMGFELVEMQRNRGSAWCCGAGGGVKSGFPEWALETAMERIREAERTGADTLVTTCPFCQMNLAQAASSLGSHVEVVDLNRLLLKALD